MSRHIFLPGYDIEEILLVPSHKEWLEQWLHQNEDSIEKGIVSSSNCLQAALSEIILYGELKTDWLGIIKEYLQDEEGYPIAYSERYGKLLYKFDDQWLQTPIHCIHAQWWIESLGRDCKKTSERYASIIKKFINPNGWIYNSVSSSTRIRNRMKSELTMSMAMGIEILMHANLLENHKERFEATLSSEPFTGYMSAEYFRMRSFEFLDSCHLAPVDIDKLHTFCEAGEAYGDFSMTSKTDDYMGTAKRTQRDKAIHSPLISLFANYIVKWCSEDVRNAVKSKLELFGNYLLAKPLDIPAFRMRDIDVPFGTGVSPLEVICASIHIQNSK